MAKKRMTAAMTRNAAPVAHPRLMPRRVKIRINGSIESIREILTTAIQVNLALIGISDNEVTKRLAAWGALITVPTLIAGIYGMNFKHMPELDAVLGYPLVVFGMVAIDAFLFLRFRRAGWI